MPKSRAKKSSTKGFTKNSAFPPKLLNGSALSKLDNTSSQTTQPSSSSSSSSSSPLVVANKLLNDNDDNQMSFGDGFVTKDKENLTASTSTNNNLNKPNVSYLCSLVKEQLKIECRKRGLKTKGNRLELLQRLGVKSARKSGNQKPTDQQFLENNLAKMELTKRKEKKTNAATAAATSTKSNSTSRKNLAKLRAERDNLVIWRSPFKTLNYCSKEILTLVQIYGKKVLRQRAILALILVLVVILGIFYNIPGRHQVLIEVIKRHTWFCTYWVGLGVLSSVGLGTGLHTFLLYLGPHIASVTLAAYECNSLNFPQPPYPDDIICPDVPDTRFPPNLWNIMSKVRLEAFLWGAGTALGELPPYFMAKAARLSGTNYDEEDIFEDKENSSSSGDDNSIMEKGKVFMEKVVEKIGFFGILACASIPNPLFDLAGITCGHFLIPFWTFFGATLIGKAIIKMHIQKIFIIIAFNEALIEKAVDYLIFVPVVGKNLQQPFKLFLENQKQRLHNRKNAKSSDAAGNIISKIFEFFVIAMVLYFIISIVNSFAQSYHKRLYQGKDKKKSLQNNNQQQHNSKTKAN